MGVKVSVKKETHCSNDEGKLAVTAGSAVAGALTAFRTPKVVGTGPDVVVSLTRLSAHAGSRARHQPMVS